jgi:hypothetical protein
MTDYNAQHTIQNLLGEMRAGFASVAEQFRIINMRLDRIEVKLEMVDAKLERLNKRLLDMEGTSDLHAKRITDLESTPGFWEAVERARGERDR